MDRRIVYPGAIPLDLDLLEPQRNTEIALGYLMQAAFGTTTIIDGLAVSQQASPNMTVQVGPGSIIASTAVDTAGVAFGSLPVDTTNLVKIGVNKLPVTMAALTAPATAGQSQNWLIEAQFLEADGVPVVLPYYNASTPAVPYTGPTNSGTAQNTRRTNTVQLQWKAGAAAATGQQNTPRPDAGWVGVAIVTLANGQASITNASISPYASAPYVPTKLSAQRVRLLAPLNLYLSPYGDDTVNSGLSPASPFLTIQKAWNTLVNGYDLNGQNVTVNIANGTYTAGLNASGSPLGMGSGNTIMFVGNAASPASVQITVSNSNCFSAINGAFVTVSGVTLSATGSGPTGFGLNALTGAGITIGGGVVFGAAGSAHIAASNGGFVSSQTGYTISGPAPYHWLASAALISITGQGITLTGTPAFTAFAFSGLLGNIECYNNVFAGTATGAHYSASANSVINTAGGSAAYLPGSTVGSTTTGGQYV